MNKYLSEVIEFGSKIIPFWFYPRMVRRSSVDVFYHAVSDEPMTHAIHLYSVVPESDFIAALRYLKSHYQFVTYQQLHAHRMHGQPLPKNAIHISFDDGFSECFNVVRPLLQRLQIPCTFFVTTDWVDNKSMFYRNKISLCIEALHKAPRNRFLLKNLNSNVSELGLVILWLKELRLSDEMLIHEICNLLNVDWENFLQENRPYLSGKQIRKMVSEGFTIGAHTKTHRKLVDVSSQEKETEIIDSCTFIKNLTDQPIVPFSFPHSGFGIERNFLADLRDRNPFIGLLFDTKGLRKDENFVINRIWAERAIKQGRKLSPLNKIILAAYQHAWVEGVMDWGRGLRNS